MKKSKNFKVGARVYSNLLGYGIIVKGTKVMDALGMFLVEWDNTPPLQYNMGQNPAVVFEDDIMEAKDETN